MHNSATLLQALLAAFCAILCALSSLGGGGMMIGARTAAWAKGGGEYPDPLYEGVSIVGSSVRNNNGVLSNFSDTSYAKLPFTVGEWDRQWEAVLRFRISDNPSNHSEGILTGLGSGNGWSPFYSNDTYHGAVCWFSGIGWPVYWDVRQMTSVWGYDAFVFNPGEEYTQKVSFNLRRYSVDVLENGMFKNMAYIDSTRKIDHITQQFQIGTNRGLNNPFTGTVDLNYSYIMRDDGVLFWEGVRGAKKRIDDLISA